MKSSTSDQSTDLANTVKILADSAKVLAGRGDLADAEQVYTQILAAAPYHVPALQFLARQAYTAGDYQKALSLTERAIESAPDFPLLYQNRALIYRQVGKLDAALESLDKALQIRPGFPLILLNKAMLLKDLGRREEALQMAITGWRLLPDPETMSNDSTIPEVRRALIKEVADLIRSSQLAMVDGELESVIKKFGRPALGRILSAVAIYAGLQLPANPKNSLTGTGALVIPNLSVEPVRSIDNEPWPKELQAILPAVRDAGRQIFSKMHPGSQGIIPSLSNDEAMQKPLIHNFSSKQERTQMEPALSRLFDILPLEIDPDIPTGISLIQIPVGNHIVSTGNEGNWKLTAYVPLSVTNPVTFIAGIQAVPLSEGDSLLVSEQVDHVFQVQGPDPLLLLSFAIMNPELCEAEIAGVRAVLRAFRRYRSQYIST